MDFVPEGIIWRAKAYIIYRAFPTAIETLEIPIGGPVHLVIKRLMDFIWTSLYIMQNISVIGDWEIQSYAVQFVQLNIINKTVGH